MMIEIPKDVDEAFDDADCAGPASEQLISTVERQLGVFFPPEYAAFLRRYGAALFRGFEIYGLVEAANDDEPPVWSDLRNVLRGRQTEQIPSGRIPISDDGGDYAFFLAPEMAAREGEASIEVYGPGLDGLLVSPGFFDFVLRASKEGVSSFIR